MFLNLPSLWRGSLLLPASFSSVFLRQSFSFYPDTFLVVESQIETGGGDLSGGLM